MNALTAITIDPPEDDLPEFHVTIPDPLLCMPDRARFIGGRAHNHPSHTSLVVDATPAPAPPPHSRALRFSLESLEPKCAVTFGSRHATFAGLSRKTGEMVSGRGPHEYAVFRRFEVDPGTVTYVLQGSKITCRSEDEATSHLADYIALKDDGRIVTGEIKANASHFAPADYHARMEDVANGHAEYGIEFRRDTGGSLRGDARLEFNISRAFGDRFTRVPTRARAAVHEKLAGARGPVPLGQIEELLEPQGLLARAMAHALLCVRDIAFPLDTLIDGETPVVLPTHPKSIPDIRAIRLGSEDF